MSAPRGGIGGEPPIITEREAKRRGLKQLFLWQAPNGNVFCRKDIHAPFVSTPIVEWLEREAARIRMDNGREAEVVEEDAGYKKSVFAQPPKDLQIETRFLKRKK